MSSFPPKDWQVRHLKDLDLYEAGTPARAKLLMEALLVAKPASGQEGTFKFVVAGADKILIELKVSDIWMDSCFSDMTVMADITSGSLIKLQKNSTTSSWVDVEELVRAQEADVLNAEGDDVAEQFLEAWDDIRKQHPLGHSLGLVWRWAITVKEDGSGLDLLVQALPSSLGHIKCHSELRQVINLI